MPGIVYGSINLKIVLWGLHTNLQVPPKELSKIPTIVFFWYRLLYTFVAHIISMLQLRTYLIKKQTRVTQQILREEKTFEVEFSKEVKRSNSLLLFNFVDIFHFFRGLLCRVGSLNLIKFFDSRMVGYQVIELVNVFVNLI